jgi:hypothetical protein
MKSIIRLRENALDLDIALDDAIAEAERALTRVGILKAQRDEVVRELAEVVEAHVAT